MFLKNINFKSTSSITLIVVNILLAILAVVLEWELFDILLVFWAESLVIGFFNILKMLKIQVKQRFRLNVNASDSAVNDQIKSPFNSIFILIKGFAIVFFAFLFFLFSALQIGFIYVLFGDFSFIEFVLNLIDRKIEIQINDMTSFLIGVGIIFLSHGISFFVNYIGKKEYETISLKKLLFAPFRRIILVWAVIVAGSYIIVYFGKNSVVLLTLFFVVKIFFDLRQHAIEHRENKINKHAKEQKTTPN